MCKYGLLYLVAFAIPVLRVQLRFVNCINKRKKKKKLCCGCVVTTQQFETVVLWSELEICWPFCATIHDKLSCQSIVACRRASIVLMIVCPSQQYSNNT